jgi:hypothetical protein
MLREITIREDESQRTNIQFFPHCDIGLTAGFFREMNGIVQGPPKTNRSSALKAEGMKKNISIIPIIAQIQPLTE